MLCNLIKQLNLTPPAVDYPSTTSYYWPDIAENVTQVFFSIFLKRVQFAF